MLYKNIYYVGLAVYATLSRTTFGADYIAYANKNPHTCGPAGPSDRCVFYCDDEKYKKDFDCGNAGICEIMCDMKQCFESSTITATNSERFIVNAGTGEKCYNQATFLLPASGDATFNADNNANHPFQKMTIHAGAHTQSISIDCTGGDSKNECTAMQINAQTAQSLYINAEAAELKGPTTIHCPENTDNSGPHGSACFINSRNKASLSAISIHTLDGIPRDFNFEGDEKKWTNVVLQCTNINSTAVVVDADIISQDTTINTCYNPATWPPTPQTLAPTPRPTSDSLPPTKSPTRKPTKSPTLAPTPEPTKYPTKYPSVSPTEDPTRYPTRSPSALPTRYPSVSPTRYPSTPPSAFPSAPPTRYPSVSPTKHPSNTPSKTPTMPPTRNPTNVNLQITNANTRFGTAEVNKEEEGDNATVTDTGDALLMILLVSCVALFILLAVLFMVMARYVRKQQKKEDAAVVNIAASTSDPDDIDKEAQAPGVVQASSNLGSMAQKAQVALWNPNAHTQPHVGFASAVQSDRSAVEGIIDSEVGEDEGHDEDEDEDEDILQEINVTVGGMDIDDASFHDDTDTVVLNNITLGGTFQDDTDSVVLNNITLGGS